MNESFFHTIPVVNLNNLQKKSILFSLLLIFVVTAGLAKSKQRFKVREGFRNISVRVYAPIPTEVENETHAKALSREAAIVIAQTHILNHILKKKTRSRKTLEEAEVPSLELQGRIRGMIKGARAVSTKWRDGKCFVKLVMSKRQLRRLLREN